MAGTAIAPTRVPPAGRVWRADGQAATVTEVGQLGVYAVLDGERLPVILGDLAWRRALACDYCDHPAEMQLRPEHGADLLCTCCSRSQFERPADWVRPIPRTTIRRLYAACPDLV